MPRVLLLILALIVYGSLFPFEFHVHPLSANPLAIMARSAPTMDRIAVRDVFINLAIYVPLGAAVFLQLARKRSMQASLVLAILSGLALSFSIEFLQIFDAGRTPSLVDVFCNVAGAAVGAWLAAAWQPQLESLLSAGIHARDRVPDAVALLGLFVVHQLYPLFPNLSQYGLRSRIGHLVHSSWHAPELLSETAGWLAIAVIVQAIFAKRARGAFLTLLLLLPARLFIVGRGPGLDHFVGALIALAVLITYRRPLSARWVCALFLLAMVVRGLAPFRFDHTSHGFTWVPFAGTLGSEWIAGADTLLRKALDYGVAVWLLVASGLGWKGAAVSVAALLAAIEVAQQWLPGRTSEITDPVLALLMATALWSLRHDPWRQRR